MIFLPTNLENIVLISTTFYISFIVLFLLRRSSKYFVLSLLQAKLAK